MSISLDIDSTVIKPLLYIWVSSTHPNGVLRFPIVFSAVDHGSHYDYCRRVAQLCCEQLHFLCIKIVGVESYYSVIILSRCI